METDFIHVTGYRRARRIKRRGFAGVITIEDPHAPVKHRLRFHNDPRPPHLVLRFEDLDAEHTGIRTPQASDVAAALEFAQEVEGPLLIHCYAGVSRSTAVALAILANRLAPGAEQQALAALLSIAPHAVPNLLVVRHADDLLRRNGALLQAVRTWDETRPTNQRRRRLNREAVLAEYPSPVAQAIRPPQFRDDDCGQ